MIRRLLHITQFLSCVLIFALPAQAPMFAVVLGLSTVGVVADWIVSEPVAESTEVQRSAGELKTLRRISRK